MIGLIAHNEKPGVENVLRSVIAELVRCDMPFAVEPHVAEMAGSVGAESVLPFETLAARSDTFITLGGDGTILRLVYRLGDVLRPVFGINIGSLGFLTCAAPSEIAQMITAMRNGGYVLSERTLLRAELLRDGKTLQTFHALNDVVTGRGARPEMVRLKLTLNGISLINYNADGLIVATPTGSTAYSLSAGGPVLVPESKCFVVTPICPHVLTNRATVVGDDAVIEASVAERSDDVVLTIDGQDMTALKFGDTLRITKSDRIFPLAMLRPFPEILREKLKWSGSNI